MDNLAKTQSPEELYKAWKALEEEKPGIRIREAAIALNSSEAQLLATTLNEETVRLNSNWEDLLKRLPELGRVMSLTRNDACILEHKGAFEKVSVFGRGDHKIGTVIGPIETRVFLKSWYVAFAVKQMKRDRQLTSIQVFDHEGNAVTKIYLQDKSNYEAYEQIVVDFKAENQSKAQEVSSYEPIEFDANPNAEVLLEAWANLKDTHDFFPLLRKHNVHRYHALELAEGKFTQQISTESIQPLLEEAAKQKLPIMIFAGNRGNLQIHQDKVRTIRLLERGHTGAERWLNVLDPDFNMHLRADLVDSAWVVEKPTTDGSVISIEVFDANKEMIAQFFGIRKPGIPQTKEWKALVNNLSDSFAKVVS
ncbi:MAG: hemin-degrading factor [Thalassobius sp.]|nr:hemin-degrading factor [Thalassovita sp.]